MENFVFEETLKDDIELKDVEVDDIFKRLQFCIYEEVTKIYQRFMRI